ncbi:MAG: ATPase, T2SS/T4P/T4SS family [Phycisphaerales bacterium]
MTTKRLDIESGFDQGKRIELGEQPVTIGRHPDNLFVIGDERASRFHCVVDFDRGDYVLRDLDSSNGTKLNERAIEWARLQPGDAFRIGDTRFRFVDPDAPPAKKSAAAATTATAAGGGGRSFDPVKFDQSPLEIDDIVAGRGNAGGATRSAPADSSSVAAPSLEEPMNELRAMSRAALADPDAPLDPAALALLNAKGALTYDSGSTPAGTASGDAVQLLRLMLLTALITRATDLHLEPNGDRYSVRLRVDGALTDAASLDAAAFVRLAGVVKALAGLEVASSDLLQEGHFSAQALNRRIGYRVSVSKSGAEQRLVIRIADSHRAPRELDELRLPEPTLERLRAFLRREAGFLLVAGPAGSGKTTTAYAAMREVDHRRRRVVTIEETIEYPLEGAAQLAVNGFKGESAQAILRTVLRQDADVIFLGEANDRDTVADAFDASTSGRLVLSTIEAMDAVSAAFRVLDLGLEPYRVASSLSMILAQRLIRVLCPSCKEEGKPTEEQLESLRAVVEFEPAVYRPGGCPRCLDTGYRGRRAIVELLVVTDALRDEILESPTIQGVRAAANLDPRDTLRGQGFTLVARGLTTFGEVNRVAGA